MTKIAPSAAVVTVARGHARRVAQNQLIRAGSYHINQYFSNITAQKGGLFLFVSSLKYIGVLYACYRQDGIDRIMAINSSTRLSVSNPALND